MSYLHQIYDIILYMYYTIWYCIIWHCIIWSCILLYLNMIILYTVTCHLIGSKQLHVWVIKLHISLTMSFFYRIQLLQRPHALSCKSYRSKIPRVAEQMLYLQAWWRKGFIFQSGRKLMIFRPSKMSKTQKNWHHCQLYV